MTMQATEPTTAAIVPPTDEIEQTPTALAAESSTIAAADGDAGAAATAAEFKFDTDEDVERALESIPQLRARLEKERSKAQDDGFQNGRQRRDKELRLERGNEDVARAWETAVLRDHGVELDESVRREVPLWVTANREAERELFWRTNAEVVLDAFDVPDREQITAYIESFEGQPEQMEQLGRSVVDRAVARTAAKQVAALTLADIPESSALHGDVRKFIDAEVTKEIEARAAEAKAPPGAPAPLLPRGNQATPRTQADYAVMTPVQIANLPDDEYRIAMGYPAA